MVNTLDVDIKETLKKYMDSDKLSAIFELQADLMKKYGLGVVDIDSPQGQKLLREMAGYVTEELYEAINCLKNRPWNKTHVPTDKDHFFEEMADSTHFFIQLIIMVGISPQQFFETYVKKVKVNEFRLRSGY